MYSTVDFRTIYDINKLITTLPLNERYLSFYENFVIKNSILRAPIPSKVEAMLEKTPMGEREFEGAVAGEVSRLLKEIEKLNQRIADLECQLRWSESELSRHL